MKNGLKQVSGTWFDFHHPNPYEGDYWNDTVSGFSPSEWHAKIEEMVNAGFTTLVLMSVALRGKSFYPSRVVKEKWDMKTEDPLEAVLAAADAFGAEVYPGLGFFTSHTGDFTGDETSRRIQRDVATELVDRYGHHKSFHGWYLPVEAGINRYYPPGYTDYANEWAALCRNLTPGKPILIAPYGTRTIEPDDKFVQQLRSMEIDYFAYQDEVGVEKTRVEELDGIFRRLKAVHDAAGVPVWADVEFFRFEGKVYGSSLLPAPFERVRAQLETIGPYVEKILCYQYWGLMNPPNSPVHSGHHTSVELYVEYQNWLKERGFQASV